MRVYLLNTVSDIIYSGELKDENATRFEVYDIKKLNGDIYLKYTKAHIAQSVLHHDMKLDVDGTEYFFSSLDDAKNSLRYHNIKTFRERAKIYNGMRKRFEGKLADENSKEFFRRFPELQIGD